jgi:enolase
MTTIEKIDAIEILDSRGNPTIEVILTTSNGIVAIAKTPSGASTGEHEALELRDKDPKRFLGKGVLTAVSNVKGPINDLLKGQSVFEQKKLDQMMIDADGTETKAKFGANAIIAVSMAISIAAAKEKRIPLYKYLGGENSDLLPCPMMNIINGGAHGDNMLEFQEFMIRPIGAPSFHEAIRYGAETFHSLKSILKKNGFSTSVGDEGGFAPNLESNEQALNFIIEAIEKAGYKPGKDITIALDLAASEFFDKETKTYIEKKKKLKNLKYFSKTPEELALYLEELVSKYPIDSIEDGMDENDWEGWEILNKKLGSKIQIVGDDLLVTNVKFLQRAIETKACNSILIKLNQIGTVTETLNSIELAKKNNFSYVISHRSGETADSYIADFAVATKSGQIKTGSLSRSDRIAKYNRLLEIEHELGSKAKYYK